MEKNKEEDIINWCLEQIKHEPKDDIHVEEFLQKIKTLSPKMKEKFYELSLQYAMELKKETDELLKELEPYQYLLEKKEKIK